VVRWEGTATPSLRLAVAHLGAGVAVALGVAVLGLLAAVAYASLVGGRTDVPVLLGTLLFVGGPFSLLSLLAVRREATPANSCRRFRAFGSALSS
jgi:hypothetical protein